MSAPLRVVICADSVGSTDWTLEAFVGTKRLTPPIVTLATMEGLPEIASISARSKTANLAGGPTPGVHVTIRFSTKLLQQNVNGKVAINLWQADLPTPPDQSLIITAMPPPQIPDTW